MEALRTVALLGILQLSVCLKFSKWRSNRGQYHPTQKKRVFVWSPRHGPNKGGIKKKQQASPHVENLAQLAWPPGVRGTPTRVSNGGTECRQLATSSNRTCIDHVVVRGRELWIFMMCCDLASFVRWQWKNMIRECAAHIVLAN